LTVEPTLPQCHVLRFDPTATGAHCRRLAREDERDNKAKVVSMLDDLRRSNRIASQPGRWPGCLGLCGAVCVLLVLTSVPTDAKCDAPEPAARNRARLTNRSRGASGTCAATRTAAGASGWLGRGIVQGAISVVEHHGQRVPTVIFRVCSDKRRPVLDAAHARALLHLAYD
jgi:hypothetical protein